MALTAETIARHELVGLEATVTAAADPTLVGIEGSVVEETTNTLVVETDGRTRRVPKADATFEFALPGTADAVVDGERLVARPPRRTEQTGDSKWH